MQLFILQKKQKSVHAVELYSMKTYKNKHLSSDYGIESVFLVRHIGRYWALPGGNSPGALTTFLLLRLRLMSMLAKNVVDLLHREFVQAHDLGLGAERGR